MTKTWIIAFLIWTMLGICHKNGIMAQSVQWQKIVEWSDTTRPTGGLPSLHSKVVAFEGYTPSGELGIWTSPADAATAPLAIVGTTDVVPNATQPNRTFTRFDFPSIYNGNVVFTGSWTNQYHTGIYAVAASGGPITTVLDAALISQKPAFASIGREGISFRVSPSFGTPPAFVTSDGAPRLLALPQTPAPGGGNFQLFDKPESPSYGAGSIVFPATVGGQSSGAIGGIYEYSLASEELLLVANGNTPFPGENFSFHSMLSADVDAKQIVFSGQGPGFVGFGAVSGVFTAPVAANGTGPIHVVARSGDPAPGGGIFQSFGAVTVDEDLVLFMGVTGHPAAGTPAGIYGSYRGGAPFAILRTGEVLDSHEIVGIGLSSHGHDKHQVALSLQYSTGSTVFYPPAIYIASIELPRGDLDGDGAYTCLDVDTLVRGIVSGPYAWEFDLNSDGLANHDDLATWLSEAGSANLGPHRAYFGSDFNLDGVVDGADFGLWNSAKFTMNPSFCSGDANADGVVDGVDFNQWNAEKFQASRGTQLIPEPRLIWGMLWGGWALIHSRRSRFR